MKVFKEEQKFTQWWLWVLNIGILLIPIYGIVQQVFYKTPFGDSPMSDTGLFIFLACMLLFNYFFLVLKLETTINEKSISYRFFPIQRNTKIILWKNIEKAYIRKYSPITEYGGWGIKHGAYNVKGNIGLQLKFKNGKKILIGTQKIAEIERILKTYENKIVNEQTK